MVSFIEENKDFVLKLKIALKCGEKQVRRVCLSHILDGKENVSYVKLLGLVLDFTLNEAGATVGGNEHAVSLTYYDNEKDLITLASTEDLIDAINLFSGQKFMRIITRVKSKSYSVNAAAATHNHHDTPSAASSTSTVDRGTSTNNESGDDKNLPPALPMQFVLKSFAGILVNAAQELKGLATTQTQCTESRNSNHQASKESIETKIQNKGSSNVEKKVKKSVYATAATAGGSRPTNASGTKEEKEVAPKVAAATAATLNVQKKTHSESEDSTCSAKGSKRESTLFIHGRHTCDSCLTTPIVGKRYHATNLPDYDVCSRCFNNHSGDAIKFDTVELNRDIPMQGRWHKRHRRQLMLMKRQIRLSQRRGRNIGGIIKPKLPPFAVRSASNGIQDTPSAPGDANDVKSPVLVSRVDSSDDADANSGAAPEEQYGNALKEAIRRSLDDIFPKESIVKAEESNEEKIMDYDIPKSVSECEEKKCMTSAEENINNDAFSKPGIPKGDEPKTGMPLNDMDNLSVRIDCSKNDVPRSVDIVNCDVLDELQVAEMMEKSMETDSVDSERLLSEGSAPPKVSSFSATDCKTHAPKSKKSLNNSTKDDSFSSDAVGNGDVAEVIGKTLDTVAGVISEMLFESDQLESLEESKEMVNMNESGDFNPSVDGNKEESKMKNGELILNSNDEMTTKSDNEEDDDEWSVVKSVRSGGTTESEQIRRAAELIGSALFNSDIKTSSEENGADLMESDSSFSLPSSVPTDTTSSHSRATAQSMHPCRWSKELEKLHELGFENDAKSIEILEFEVTSDETGINVEKVVNELLELEK